MRVGKVVGSFREITFLEESLSIIILEIVGIPEFKPIFFFLLLLGTVHRVWLGDV